MVSPKNVQKLFTLLTQAEKKKKKAKSAIFLEEKDITNLQKKKRIMYRLEWDTPEKKKRQCVKRFREH